MGGRLDEREWILAGITPIIYIDFKKMMVMPNH